MKTKTYCFRYLNPIEKFFQGFFSFFANIGIPIITYYIICVLMAIIGIIHYFTIELLVALLVVSILIGIFYAFKFCCCFKGVILYDSYLEIVT